MQPSTIHVGNAPCSWGTLEFDGDAQAERFTYTQMLDELVATGYTGSELGDWGFMPTEPGELAQTFAPRGLTLTGAFVGINFVDPAAHAPGVETVSRTATLLRQTADRLQQAHAPFIVLADDNCRNAIRTQNAGRITPSMGLSDSQWQTYAEGVNHVARAAYDATGLRSVFHHHCGGYVETVGEIERLLAETDPEYVGLVFDTGHFAYGVGGCDRVLWALERFATRIGYIHFKDCDPQVLEQAAQQGWDYFEAVRHAVFCELGQGCVDFPGVLAWLEARGYDGYITVEQDVLPGMGSPKASAARNRAYLESIGLR
ncbi:MAG: TIM barrel protein [Litorilinea sp.]